MAVRPIPCAHTNTRACVRACTYDHAHLPIINPADVCDTPLEEEEKSQHHERVIAVVCTPDGPPKDPCHHRQGIPQNDRIIQRPSGQLGVGVSTHYL